MSCLITAGVALGCRDNIGGIDTVYIGNFNTAVTYTTGTNSIIEAFTGGTVSYHTFDQEIEVAEFNEAVVASTENGTVVFEQTLSITLHKNDGALKNTIKLLSQGHLSILILDQRGVYHLMGKDNGVRASEGTLGVGKAFVDLNGFILSFIGKESEPANEVNQTLTNLTIVAN